MGYDAGMIRRRVLILNADFRPISAVSWKRAIRLSFEGTCFMLEMARKFDGTPIKIHSPNAEWDLPSVMMNPSYVVMGDTIRYSRHNCFARDSYTCQYCGDPDMEDLTIDHVQAKSIIKGREGNLWYNRVTCCSVCNGQKANRPLEDMIHERCWNGRTFRLIREPFEPGQASLSRFVRLVNRDSLEWLNYIPNWQRMAKRLRGRGWLLEAYEEWKNDQIAD